MNISDYRKQLEPNRKYYKGSELKAYIPKKLYDKNDEIALGIRFIINRPLFGGCYEQLFPKYFNSMPPNSGVLIGAFIDTDIILKGKTYPGDIDLLIIPYEGDELVLSKTMAVELKITRASFKKQGKSPNQYGFSQAEGLLKLGFPYVAVGHIIISDESPKTHWRDMGLTTIINSDTGECSPLKNVKADFMPADLIRRSYGRLKANRKNRDIGFFSTYFSEEGIWFPSGKTVRRNKNTCKETLDSVWDYYCKNTDLFLDTRRYE